MSAEPANRNEEILQQLHSPVFLIELRLMCVDKNGGFRLGGF